MTVTYNFTQGLTTTATLWVSLKWTYLVVSSTFDGTYTNIWCTFSTFSGPFPNANTPVIPAIPPTLIFNQLGGATGDCDIYVDPLFQADLQNCEAVPANGQYKGGKIIIHAYISGFQSNFSSGVTNVQTIKAGTGGSPNPQSDS